MAEGWFFGHKFVTVCVPDVIFSVFCQSTVGGGGGVLQFLVPCAFWEGEGVSQSLVPGPFQAGEIQYL